MFYYAEDLYDDEFEEDEIFYDDIEEDPYEEIREVLAAEYQDLPPEDIEVLLESAGLSAEDMEFSLKKAFGTIGKAAKQIAPKALPFVGGAVGTLVGGPAGTAIGTALGSAAGRAIGRAGAPGRPTARPPSPRRAPMARPGLRPSLRPRRPSVAGSPAAAQLLQLLSRRPEILQGLLATALGPAGQRNIRVGNTPVPPGAIANLVGVLANQAAAEYNAMAAFNGEGVPRYLLDAEGELLADAAVPEERAAVLLGLIEQAAWERDTLADMEEEDDDEDFEETLAMLEEDLYDQMELDELYLESAWEN